MSPAALRVLTGGALGVLAWASYPQASAADSPARPSPTRPGEPRGPALSFRKFGGLDYVDVAGIALRLGLKISRVEPGRRLSLSAPGRRAELEADTRDITVNGLRVFLGNPVVDAGGQLFVSRMDYERCLTPLLRPGYGVAPLRRPQTIALDPGHGGKDNGTSANEKAYALDVALRTKKMLEAAGYRVVLTRDDDTFIELSQRAAVANAARADLFVSIHFNALANDSKTTGVEVYTFAPQSQNSTNAWGPGQKPDAESTVASANAFDHWNVVLAQALHRELLDRLKAPDRGKKLMHLAVLRPLKCPGVLVECGFLTSEAEARRIATPAYRQQIAEALHAGIRGYVADVEVAAGSATSNTTISRPSAG